MHNNIVYVKQYCIRQLKSWKHIANFLNEDVKLLLVKQIIFSKIDYCNSLFVNLPKFLLRHLDCVINSAFMKTSGTQEKVPLEGKMHCIKAFKNTKKDLPGQLLSPSRAVMMKQM